MSVLWLMPSWSAPSELWMQRMLAAVEDHLAAIACYEPASPTWGPKRIRTLDLGRRSDPVSIDAGRAALQRAVTGADVHAVFAHYLPFALRYEDVLSACGKPVFVHGHGYDVTPDLRRPDTHGKPVPFHPPDYPKQLRRLATWATIVANSHHTKAKLVALGIPGHRVTVKYLGVPIPPIASRPSKIPNSPLNLLYLGRLVDFKGPDLLLRAFDRAAAMGLDATLTLAGDGPLLAACQAIRESSAYKDHITLLGAVDAPTGQRLRAAADVFTTHNLTGPTTNQEEAFGVAIAEAMAAGLPVVSTTSGSLPELVTHERTGLLVPPGDIAAHAAAVLRLQRDPLLRQTLGQNARLEAEARFSTDIERAALYRMLGLTPTANR